MKTTTQKIKDSVRELSKEGDSKWEVETDPTYIYFTETDDSLCTIDDLDTIAQHACLLHNNAIRMAELLETAYDIIQADEGSYDYAKKWITDFEKFQKGEN